MLISGTGYRTVHVEGSVIEQTRDWIGQGMVCTITFAHANLLTNPIYQSRNYVILVK
jgi:hypothetical protein